MLKAIMFVIALTLLIMTVNRWAVYRSENELVARICLKREKVLSNLSAVLLNKLPHVNAMSETRDKMIASKLMFMLPQHHGEENAPYLNRVSFYLKKRCKALAKTTKNRIK